MQQRVSPDCFLPKVSYSHPLQPKLIITNSVDNCKFYDYLYLTEQTERSVCYLSNDVKEADHEKRSINLGSSFPGGYSLGLCNFGLF
jgi:hypothetical protein